MIGCEELVWCYSTPYDCVVEASFHVILSCERTCLIDVCTAEHVCCVPCGWWLESIMLLVLFAPHILCMSIAFSVLSLESFAAVFHVVGGWSRSCFLCSLRGICGHTYLPDVWLVVKRSPLFRAFLCQVNIYVCVYIYELRWIP